MTRTDAITLITTKLAELPDEHVATVADFVQSIGAGLPLDLTDDERAALERSREDFKHGRVLDDDQYNARMDAFMAQLRTQSQSAT